MDFRVGVSAVTSMTAAGDGVNFQGFMGIITCESCQILLCMHDVPLLAAKKQSTEIPEYGIMKSAGNLSTCLIIPHFKVLDYRVIIYRYSSIIYWFTCNKIAFLSECCWERYCCLAVCAWVWCRATRTGPRTLSVCAAAWNLTTPVLGRAVTRPTASLPARPHTQPASRLQVQ